MGYGDFSHAVRFDAMSVLMHNDHNRTWKKLMQLNFTSWHDALHMINMFLLILIVGAMPFQSEAATNIQEDKIPDLLLTLDPYRITDYQAASGLVQIGMRDIRVNGTYALSIEDKHLFKVSAEYLHEKLGFGFQAGRIHAWVYQYAVGAEYRLCSPCTLMDYVDLGLNYSHSPSRDFHQKLVPEEDLINNRRIAGADAVAAQAQSLWTVGKGSIGGALFYDYVRYRRTLQHEKVVTGPGLGLNVHYPLWTGTKIHLNAELRRPYLFLEARLGWNMRFWKLPIGSSLFIESVRGFQSLPSSTRFGVEFAFHFNPPQKKNCTPVDYSCPTAVQLFAKMPAVYRPQVLAISDESYFGFTDMPRVLQSLPNLTVPVGSFSFDASGYFAGGSPIVYVGYNFPPGLEIDPLTGVISGAVDAGAIGSYAAEIAVVNYTGRIVQPVLIQVVP
jgi:hypothetical protein